MSQKKPNLIYMFADQLRLCSMGYYGDKKAITPNIDALSHDSCNLINAVSGFYGARTEAQKVITSASQFNASATQDAAAKNQAADLTLIEDRVKALMVEIQAIAQMATSLFNNVHASAGTNYSGNS